MFVGFVCGFLLDSLDIFSCAEDLVQLLMIQFLFICEFPDRQLCCEDINVHLKSLALKGL